MAIQSKDAPGMRMYYQDSLADLVEVFVMFGLVAILITLYKLYRQDTSLREKYLLLVSWGIIPPVWFVIEYYFVFMPYGMEGSFQYFEYGQSVASKLWGAVSALIALVIYRDTEKKKQEEAEEEDESRSGDPDNLEDSGGKATRDESE